jgi:hypothetical protein
MLSSMPQLKKPALTVALLILGDLAVFYVFALVGLRSHERGLTPWLVIRTALPFQAGWLLGGAYLGAFDTGRPRESSRLPRVVLTWLPAWAMGLAGRSFIFGSSIAPIFAVITFVTNLLLMLAWRTVAVRLLSPARERETAARP